MNSATDTYIVASPSDSQQRYLKEVQAWSAETFHGPASSSVDSESVRSMGMSLTTASSYSHFQ